MASKSTKQAFRQQNSKSEEIQSDTEQIASWQMSYDAMPWDRICNGN